MAPVAALAPFASRGHAPHAYVRARLAAVHASAKRVGDLLLTAGSQVTEKLSLFRVKTGSPEAYRERERWPTDQAAVDEASDLIVFLDSCAAGDEVDAFIVAKRGYTNVHRGISHPSVRDALAQLIGALQSQDLRTVRRSMLLLLDRIGRSQACGSEWFAGAEDFSEWRAAQARAHSVASTSLAHIRRTRW